MLTNSPSFPNPPLITEYKFNTSPSAPTVEKISFLLHFAYINTYKAPTQDGRGGGGSRKNYHAALIAGQAIKERGRPP